MKGIVQIDETLFGVYSEENNGRSLETKTAILLAVEYIGGGRTGNIRMEVIENFTADLTEDGKNNMMANGNQLKTDKHKSYIKMKDNSKTIETGMSNAG